MVIKLLKYSQFFKEKQEWGFERFSLAPINLLVGRNASGKTRLLNVLKNLGKLLSGDMKPAFASGDFDITFQLDHRILRYILVYKDSEVIREELSYGKKNYLKRGKNGRGKIWAEKSKRYQTFQTPPDQLACVARRDDIQHSFFQPLYDWGNGVIHFSFGASMGKSHYYLGGKNEETPATKGKSVTRIFKETEKVVSVFKSGIQDFGIIFKHSIIRDMKEIGYEIKDIGLMRPQSLFLDESIPGQLTGLYLEEKDLKCPTDQNDISQGMFRALSIIIHLNYVERGSLPSCILIDDIGEGLDFNRATSLINLIRKKIKPLSAQLIMSTNDRFVMNQVPLEEWAIIDRRGPLIKIYNYLNSKKSFEEFKFTGLTNFDFFSSDFVVTGHDE